MKDTMGIAAIRVPVSLSWRAVAMLAGLIDVTRHVCTGKRSPVRETSGKVLQ